MEDEDEHVRDSAYYALEAGQIPWFLRFFLEGWNKNREISNTNMKICVFLLEKNWEDYN